MNVTYQEAKEYVRIYSNRDMINMIIRATIYGEEYSYYFKNKDQIGMSYICRYYNITPKSTNKERIKGKYRMLVKKYGLNEVEAAALNILSRYPNGIDDMRYPLFGDMLSAELEGRGSSAGTAANYNNSGGNYSQRQNRSSNNYGIRKNNNYSRTEQEYYQTADDDYNNSSTGGNEQRGSFLWDFVKSTFGKNNQGGINWGKFIIIAIVVVIICVYLYQIRDAIMTLLLYGAIVVVVVCILKALVTASFGKKSQAAPARKKSARTYRSEKNTSAPRERRPISVIGLLWCIGLCYVGIGGVMNGGNIILGIVFVIIGLAGVM